MDIMTEFLIKNDEGYDLIDIDTMMQKLETKNDCERVEDSIKIVRY